MATNNEERDNSFERRAQEVIEPGDALSTEKFYELTRHIPEQNLSEADQKIIMEYGQKAGSKEKEKYEAQRNEIENSPGAKIVRALEELEVIANTQDKKGVAASFGLAREELGKAANALETKLEDLERIATLEGVQFNPVEAISKDSRIGRSILLIPRGEMPVKEIEELPLRLRISSSSPNDGTARNFFLPDSQTRLEIKLGLGGGETYTPYMLRANFSPEDFYKLMLYVKAQDAVRAEQKS